MAAAAAVAAAVAWMPIAFLFAFGPLGFALWVLFGLAALGFFLKVWRTLPLIGLVLNVGAYAVAVFALLLAGCGSPAGRIDDWMWAVSGLVAFALGFWSLLHPTRAWWGLPAATLAAAAVVIVLAVALHGNTGLCPD